MIVSFTGRQEDIRPQHRTKIETRLAKIAKMLDGRKGEKEAHVVFRHERFVHQVEIQINVFDNGLVCVGEDADLATAVSDALDKVERQAVRLREKNRDSHRQSPEPGPEQGGETTTPRSETPSRPGTKIFRVEQEDGYKPMTVDEAVIEMEHAALPQGYYVFRDAASGRLSVVMRRPDGNYDVIES